MGELDRFKELFNKMLQGVSQAQLRFAICNEVDWENKTMTAIGVTDEVPYYNVQLGFGYTDIKPTKDTICLIGILEGKETLTFLINAEDVELVEVKAKQIIYNEGKNDGLVKAKELTEKLNAVEKDLNDLKMVFKTWVTAPNDGGAALKTAAATWAGNQLTETKQTDITNDKITH